MKFIKTVRAIAVACFTLGAAFTVSAQTKGCATPPAGQKYWSDVYVSALAYGNTALEQKDLIEATKADQLATFAGQNSCVEQLSDAHKALRMGIAFIKIDRYTTKAQELLSRKDFEGALNSLDEAKKLMKRNDITASDDFRALMKTAAEGVVSAYTQTAEASLAKGEPAQALAYVQAVNKIAKEFDVAVPEQLAEVGKNAAVALVTMRTQEVQKLVAEKNFEDALEFISGTKRIAGTFNAALPAEFTALEQRAWQGQVDAFFAMLDAALINKKLPQSEFDIREANACAQITTLPIPLPDRCKKHVETKQQ